MKMDRIPEIDKFKKAKIEEPNPNLPLLKSLLRSKGARSRSSDLCYMKIFEDPGKAKKRAKAVASGLTIVRKLHRIRNKELVKFVDKNFEGMKNIHVVSEASIGVVVDAESNLLSHSFLDLLGTVDEVKHAEKFILEIVLKTYSSLLFPVILMPTTICWDKMNIPLNKVCRVLGTYGNNLLRMEMESGAWVKIEQGPSTGVWEWERVVNVFGTRENVNKAKSLIQSVISDKPKELSAAEALNELVNQFKEPSCLELLESEKKKKQKVESQTFLRVKKSEGYKQTEGESGKKKNEFKEPGWSQTFGRIIPCHEQKEEGKDPEYSGEPEKVKKVEEGGGSSTLIDKEKKQKDVEEAFVAQGI